MDRGKPAVGVDGEVLWLLNVCYWDGFGVVGDPELFENHGDLRRVGVAIIPHFNGLSWLVMLNMLHGVAVILEMTFVMKNHVG